MKRKIDEILIIGAGSVGRTCAETLSGGSKAVIIKAEDKIAEPQSMPFSMRPEYVLQPSIEKSGKQKRRERRKNKK